MNRFFMVIWLNTLMVISIVSSSIISAQTHIVATSSGISLPEGCYVTFRGECDINSDSKTETVYVYARKENDESDICEDTNIAVVTQDGLLRRTNHSGVSGSNQEVHISDFNSDGIKDILVILSKGNEKTCMIGDFAHSMPKNIITPKDLKGLEMKLAFTDGFAVSAELENGQIFSVNVSQSAQKLCESGVFDPNGTFVCGTPVISPITQISVKEHDFGSNLVFTQQLIAKESNIVLCNIQAEMEYTGDTLLIKRIEYYV